MQNHLTDKLKNAYRISRFYRVFNERKTHIYCVGTAKSGTNSIGTIFGEQLLSSHEPEAAETIKLILDKASGRISDENLCRRLLERDRRLCLDLDSSQLNFFLLDQLLFLFPAAKFILTIRNPYAWLNSFINHSLSRTPTEAWKKIRDLRFRPDLHSYDAAEETLREKGLYTLDGYLSYWAGHNRAVLEKVPSEKLLVVRTEEISKKGNEIAAFAGIPMVGFNNERSHANKARANYGVLDKIEEKYLDCKIREHCSDLMVRFFPDISCKEDAF